MNNTQLIGRLTKDPEMKYTQAGVAIANFTLAVNRPFKNAQGENEADFIRIQAWRKTAENCANFLKKGSQIAVIGRIQTGSYEGTDGKRVFTTDVVADSVQFLDTKNGTGGGNGQGQQNQGPNPNQQSQNNQQQNNVQTNQNQQQNNGYNQNNQQQNNQQQNNGYNQNNQQQNNGYNQNQQQQNNGYNQNQQQQNNGYNQNTPDPFSNGGGPIIVKDDDLPF